jgi:uncharacterized membrane protein
MTQSGRPIHDEVERIVLFSDAVFAIALTLLAVNLRLPASHEPVGELLGQMRPQLFSFLVSFVVIGVTWMSHHRMFTYIERNDAALMTANLVLLLTVTFMPFPTSVLGERHDEVGAIVFYASSIACLTMASGIVWIVAGARHLVSSEVTRPLSIYFLSRIFAITAVFLVSIPVALLVSPSAATYFWFAAIVVRVVLRVGYRERFGAAST